MAQLDVVAASPSTAVDSYFEAPALALGEVNRGVRVIHSAGGKGVNLGRAATLLGGRALVVAVVGGYRGRFVAAEMEREAIRHDLVWSVAETRHTTTVAETRSQRATVLVETSPALEPPIAAELNRRVVAAAVQARFAVVAGSLPRGVRASYFADLVTSLRQLTSARPCVDTGGPALRLAALAGAAIVKVNRSEFGEGFDVDSGGEWDWRAAGDVFEALARHGLEILAITDGQRGAYLLSRDAAPFHVRTPMLRWASPSGAGDAFLAGLLLALSRGQPIREAARYASAAGAACVCQPVCGALELADVERGLQSTVVAEAAW
jgi:1-phosphofructokinase family hexose kinase